MLYGRHPSCALLFKKIRRWPWTHQQKPKLRANLTNVQQASSHLHMVTTKSNTANGGKGSRLQVQAGLSFGVSFEPQSLVHLLLKNQRVSGHQNPNWISSLPFPLRNLGKNHRFLWGLVWARVQYWWFIDGDSQWLKFESFKTPSGRETHSFSARCLQVFQWFESIMKGYFLSCYSDFFNAHDFASENFRNTSQLVSTHLENVCQIGKVSPFVNACVI